MAAMATKLDRRDFLKAAGASGAVLTLAIAAPPLARGAAAADGMVWPPSAFLRIGEDETVTIISNKAEMGQGIYTAQAMLVAEELDVDWTKIKVESSGVDPIYNHAGVPIQYTGGSDSVRTTYDQYRTVGAAARTMLIAAAAMHWKVPHASCTVEAGYVVGPGGKEKISFGALTKAAALLPVPTEVALKPPKDFKVIGKSRLRVDAQEKIMGTAPFAIDVKLPGMLTALVLHSPVLGGKPTSVDSAKALPMMGVKAIFPISTGVAVLADGYWHAKKARDKLAVQWDTGPAATLSTQDLAATFTAMAKKPGATVREDGKVADATYDAAQVLSADYVQPYLAAATMEPLACVVNLKAGSCEVWIGTQSPTLDRQLAASMTGLTPEQITIHTTYSGGGFGRRMVLTGSDWLKEALEIAKTANLGVPIKLIWSREDDLTSGYFRPLWIDRVTAALDLQGKPVAWTQTSVGQSIVAGTPFELTLAKNGIDPFSVEGMVDMPYAIPNVKMDLHSPKVPFPSGWFRSVGHSHNAFVKETFIDELAHAAGSDPVEYRRMLLAKRPVELAVLELAADKADWGKPLPGGHFRGVALHSSFESHVAQVIEISFDDKKALKILRVVCAVDCGTVVNPDQVVAQMEGGIIFGLNTAILSEMPIKDGKVGPNNFTAYKLLRMHQAPASIEVHLVDNDRAPGGAGEPAVPVVIAALANALSAAMGERIRTLPLVNHGIKFP
jgi:isoquinoline 1-oxidoreductase beta subunit